MMRAAELIQNTVPPCFTESLELIDEALRIAESGRHTGGRLADLESEKQRIQKIQQLFEGYRTVVSEERWRDALQMGQTLSSLVAGVDEVGDWPKKLRHAQKRIVRLPRYGRMAQDLERAKQS